VLLLQTRPELPTAWGLAALLPLLGLVMAVHSQNGFSKYLRLGACIVLAGGAGFYWAAGYAAWRLSDVLPTDLEGQDVRIVGVVATLPQQTERGGRFEFEVERVIGVGMSIPQHISLSWYRDRRAEVTSTVTPFRVGERWELTARLRQPHGSVNPYGYDFELWALENNIRATGYIRSDDENRRLNEFVVRPRYVVERLRELIRDRFLMVLGDKPYTAVLVALAIGDQSGIPQAQWKTFWRTGVGHLISISGLHITMLAALAAGIVGWLWRRTRFTLQLPAHKAAAVAGFAAALVYSLLAGFSIPTQRTLYMLAIAALALWLNQLSSASRVLALALLLVLLLDPWAVLAPGFWLSFGAVAVIFYLTSNRRAEEGWFAAAARTQLAVTIGLVPLLLGMFQQVSLVSPVANAFSVPLVSFLIVPLILGAAALPLDWLLHFAHWLMAGCVALLDWLALWPSATWESHAPPVWTVVLGLAGVLWLLAPRGLPARWLGALWLAPMVFVATERPGPGALWLTALDVGQGLALVVQTQSHTLLYDTGPSWGGDTDSGSRIVVPHLRASGVRHLEGMVVSHADNDHSGGAVSVLDSVRTNWLLSSLSENSPIIGKTEQPIRCQVGQHWEWDGVSFEVLHPSPASYLDEKRKTNDLSCVVKITSSHGSALLAGDIEAVSEAEILAHSTTEKIRADVLVVPHHGSRTSSTDAFVAATSPKLALFTVGYRNPFGHPRPEVVARYESLGAKILRSDHAGAIVVKMDEQGISHTSWREEQKRYWRPAMMKEAKIRREQES
jgi:competence protein ComEC